ncbi:MAG: toll/interleukin-1 receptor domain-containing protein [Fibromonadaceae bacterium]|jgi:hypothetical protein|nr:toll/interleukin-1 receptor domain-containing protein [Fibromonadaceae bacterium]
MSKKSKKFEIFISYRRKGGYDTAKLIYDRLRMDGYSVSFDIDTLVNGNFDVELEQRVNDCKDFLLVLSPGIFDRFFVSNEDYDPENDWVRREIVCALKTNKNIVPLALEGFVFPKSLPPEVKDIKNKNAIDLYPKYFEAAYEKIKSFLISKPSWMVRHKKKIISGTAIMLLMFVASLYFAVSKRDSELSKKDLELQEAITAIEIEKMYILDSIQQVREQRRRDRTFHWNGTDDEISQVIFEKIAETGIQKTECSNNGRIASLNEVRCRINDDKKITCSYTPRIIFTTCDNKPITFLEKKERFKSSPHADSVAAKKDLANKLREADFSDWVSGIKGLR